MKLQQWGHLDEAPLRANALPSRANDVRRHFHQIVTSKAFIRSRRSCEFLEYLVDKKLAGELDELKERMIGVQLFGRDPSYDTGEDAIVRVTATDVRRRLKQFYDGSKTDIRLELSPGSYVIELVEQEIATEVLELPPPQLTQPAAVLSEPALKHSVWRRFLPAAAVLVSSGLLFGVYHFRTQPPSMTRLPWSAMFSGQRKVKIVFSDPDIATLQKISGTEISLTDYASHKYLQPQQLLDQPSSVVEHLFNGNNVPIIDANFALGVRNLLPSSQIDTFRARSLQAHDFKTEDNFILLGSPLSNPWFALFQDRLDFYFHYDQTQNEEVIYNRHPEHGEAKAYMPTTPGWGTGQAFAIIGLIENPNQTGHILILAGSNSTATEAAGRLVTDVESISHVLQQNNLNAHDPTIQFEILLRVNTMASSLDNFEVLACHRLSGATQ